MFEIATGVVAAGAVLWALQGYAKMLFKKGEIIEGEWILVNGEIEGAFKKHSLDFLEITTARNESVRITTNSIRSIKKIHLMEERVTVSFQEDCERVKSILKGACEAFNHQYIDYLEMDREKKGPACKVHVAGLDAIQGTNHGYTIVLHGMIKNDCRDKARYALREEMARSLQKEKVKMAESVHYYRTRQGTS